jgi:hypothetical protein
LSIPTRSLSLLLLAVVAVAAATAAAADTPSSENECAAADDLTSEWYQTVAASLVTLVDKALSPTRKCPNGPPRRHGAKDPKQYPNESRSGLTTTLSIAEKKLPQQHQGTTRTTQRKQDCFTIVVRPRGFGSCRLE